MANLPEFNDNDIAIVGMAAHFPGAESVRQYWKNVREGVESVRFFSDEELIAAGVPADQLLDPHYVKAGVVLENMEWFDAEFFGFSPKEAAIMDPQHRHFLETAWEALEDAGHPPEKFEGNIGVYAGCGMGAYFMFNILTNPSLIDTVGLFLLRHTGNDKDFLATRVSYCLNLRGPAINVQTACSTSLVAVHLACQSLLNGEVDMAIAGGVTIENPHYRGYHFKEGEILSPDGHCRAFDHRSKGTIFGSGAGAVILRRAKDALEDGDNIYVVIRGSAINNDGASKVGYLAPSVDGQAACIAEALAMSDVEADSINYVECHGTGTPIGDPIEVSALTQAFRESTEKKQFCGLGSVKTNIGHLDTAAGVASLIKASMALKHKQLPPSLNFEAPNPNIDFINSPFYVNHSLQEWKRGGTPRRAGINSLGVGGTNSFVILEETPEIPASSASAKEFHLLKISARNRAALDQYCKKLAAYLQDSPDTNLADLSYTLEVGRREFTQRRVLAVKSVSEAIELLENLDQRRLFTHVVPDAKASTVFMFPGGGAQYIRMGHDLYASEPVYRQHIDRGLQLMQSKHGIDLKPFLFASEENREALAKEFERPSLQLPAIFMVEFALAQLWISWGVKPDALIGHSLGENTAACLSGVMSFEDCLGLVTLRGQLFEKVQEGGMLSVSLSPEDLKPLLQDQLDLATVNSPSLCAVSGTVEQLEKLAKTLEEREIDFQRIRINIAAHSRLLEPILADFGNYLRSIKLNKPKIPFVSNRTGQWITDAQAISPDYWVEHLRGTVFFSDGARLLLQDSGRIFIECGPGKTLSSLVRQQPEAKPSQNIISSLRHPDEVISDAAFFLAGLGRVWASGLDYDQKKYWGKEQRRRISAPTYAFQRSKYWIEPGKVNVEENKQVLLKKLANFDDWFWKPVWQRIELTPAQVAPQRWLMFLDDVGIGSQICEKLRAEGHAVITVREGDSFNKRGEFDYVISPERGRTDYDALIKELVSTGHMPTRIAHFWMLTAKETFRPGSSFFHRNQERGFYSLLFLAQALGDESLLEPIDIKVFSNGFQQVQEEAVPYPEKASLLGPVKVIPREYPLLHVSSIDVELPGLKRKRFGGENFDQRELALVLEEIETELKVGGDNEIIAIRQHKRWVQEYERALPAALSDQQRLKRGGTYLITGGLGGLGLLMAEFLAEHYKANLVLLGRSAFPEESDWDGFIKLNGDTHRTSKKIAQLRDIISRGGKVLVANADVSDVDAIRSAVDKGIKRFGSINGIFHTAGVLKDDLIQMKRQADVEDVFTPKIHGTLILDEVLRDVPLDLFVLFSSTSSVIAAAGQVDYVAANAFLNAYAHARKNIPGRYTVAVNWGVWNQVGMAADSVAGVKAQAERQLASHPLYQSRISDDRANLVLEAEYSPENYWILNEHRTGNGYALIPGTGYVEMARAALRENGELRNFAIEDLIFFRPLYVADNSKKKVRVKLVPKTDGYDYIVQSQVDLPDGRSGWELHAQAKLTPCAAPAELSISIKDIQDRCRRYVSPSNPGGIKTGQEEHLKFGPRWRVLHQYAVGEGEAIAELALPDAYIDDLQDYGIHPALLDLATGYAMDLIEGYDSKQGLWVPLSYKRFNMYGRLPKRVFSWIRGEGLKASNEIAQFDVVITDENGNILLEIEQFIIRKLAPNFQFGIAPSSTTSELEFDQNEERAAEKQLSPAELAFRHSLKQGILPEEGTKALDTVLASAAQSEVIVSSMDLDALRQQATMVVKEEKSGDASKFARPNLESEYVEAKDDIERTLVGFWEELLGVNQVGVRDSFFDLGGHSLIAVRLFAKIKKMWHVEYPISVLFEAPTIEQCANLIRDVIGANAAIMPTGDAEPSERKIEKKQVRHTHLVAMHQGKAGPKTPFFLVAGMFGNVLNLRHLAHLIGTDRAFYGLQAKGLYGDEPPHASFEEMAKDYIAEMRTVQPHGPYLIGGFSGGGITAFEIAHQLREQGEEVALLVMLDTPLPTGEPLSSIDKLMVHKLRLQERGLSYIKEWAGNRYEWEMEKIRKKLGLKDEIQLTTSDFHNEEIERAFRSALGIYRLAKYPSRITLFRPKLPVMYVLGPGRLLNQHREFIFPDNGWTPWTNELEIHEVPGDHDSMVLEPNVRVLARKLRDAIQRAERGER